MTAAVHAIDGDGAPTSWEPVDRTAILNGDQLEQPPEYLARADGVPLIHAGKVTVLAGEPESCKGWKALHPAAERLAADEHVIYIDFEAGAQETVARLPALGVPAEEIADRFHYVSPDLPLTDDGKRPLAPALAHGPTLVILDGLTEAFAVHGLKIEDNVDAAKFLRLLAKPLAARGAAVILIDHVVKNREARTRYAIGAQHKLAGVDVALGLEVVRPSRDSGAQALGGAQLADRIRNLDGDSHCEFAHSSEGVAAKLSSPRSCRPRGPPVNRLARRPRATACRPALTHPRAQPRPCS